jgi:hypothetical protein
MLIALDEHATPRKASLWRMLIQGYEHGTRIRPIEIDIRNGPTDGGNCNVGNVSVAESVCVTIENKMSARGGMGQETGAARSRAA